MWRGNHGGNVILRRRPSSHHGFGDSLIRSFCLVNHVDTQGLSHKELGVYTCEVLNWNTGTQGTSQDLAERWSK